MSCLLYIHCETCRAVASSISGYLGATEMAALIAAAPALAGLATTQAAISSLAVSILGDEIDLGYFVEHRGHPLTVRTEYELSVISEAS